MAEIVLNQPGIRALIGQGEAAGVAEHVGMGGQGQPGPFAIAADGGPDGAAIERRAPFADEEGFPRRSHRRPCLQPRLDEPQFIGPQRVRGRKPFLEPGDVEAPAFDIDLRELEAAGFRDPQAMAEQQQHQAAVAGLVPRPLNGVQQPFDLAPGQVFAFVHLLSHVRVFGLLRIQGLAADHPANIGQKGTFCPIG